jgi:hypothetical protein
MLVVTRHALEACDPVRRGFSTIATVLDYWIARSIRATTLFCAIFALIGLLAAIFILPEVRGYEAD